MCLLLGTVLSWFLCYVVVMNDAEGEEEEVSHSIKRTFQQIQAYPFIGKQPNGFPRCNDIVIQGLITESW